MQGVGRRKRRREDRDVLVGVLLEEPPVLDVAPFQVLRLGLGFGACDLGFGVWGLVVVMWGLGSGGWYLGSGVWNLRALRKPRA